MLLELLASALLWAGVDDTGQATMNVSCDKISVHYGGEPSSSKRPIAFWFKDIKYDHTYLYVVSMPVGANGEVILIPTTYWLEEIRVQEKLVLKIEGKNYTFNLDGTHKAIQCD